MPARRSRVRGALLVVLAVLAVAPAATAQQGIKPVGVLERFPQEALDAFPELFQGSPFESRMLNGTVLAVPEANQLWQVYRSTAANRSGVLVRDDTTLRVVGSFRIGSLLRRATFSVGYGGEWLHARDGAGRVFLVDTADHLLEVDTTTLAVRDAGLLSAGPVDGPGSDLPAVGGLAWDPVAERLLVLYGGPANTGPANRLTVLQQYDPATGERVERVVRSCTGPLPATDATGDTLATTPLVEPDAVYVPCQREIHAPGLGVTSSSVVVRLPRAGLGAADGEETWLTVGGPMDSALLDPASARLAVLDWVGGVTVVDTRSMTVVGSFAAASPEGSGRVGPGIDAGTGRVYFQSDVGLGWADIRSGSPFPRFGDASKAAEAQEGVVPVGDRILVLTGQALEKAERYTVYKVRGN